jgi:hypothetical protein
VYRDRSDAEPAATGWAREFEGDGEINQVACLENTETSAIGRALANLGFAASKKRPSYEEMAKADRARRRLAGHTPKPTGARESFASDALQAKANIATDVIRLVQAAGASGPRRGSGRVADQSRGGGSCVR